MLLLSEGLNATRFAGHVPMLADPAFCDMVQSIGVASLCADEKQIWHLTKIYWYTVEFGVVQEGNEMKAFGAGEHIQNTNNYIFHSHVSAFLLSKRR